MHALNSLFVNAAWGNQALNHRDSEGDDASTAISIMALLAIDTKEELWLGFTNQAGNR